jgi:predicted enzyme related to lactoylglutathione lyase
VEAALTQAEELGGTRLSGPHRNPNNELSVGFFLDPEGNLIGVAGPA